jgi:hypothetical protein
VAIANFQNKNIEIFRKVIWRIKYVNKFLYTLNKNTHGIRYLPMRKHVQNKINRFRCSTMVKINTFRYGKMSLEFLNLIFTDIMHYF